MIETRHLKTVVILFGMKFENMLILVLLKIFTCWGTFLHDNINFQ